MMRQLLTAATITVAAAVASVITACIRAGDAHDFDWDQFDDDRDEATE